jgi:hypothetical protein
MEAWLNAHAIAPAPRPGWGDGPPSVEEAPDSLMPMSQNNLGSAPTLGAIHAPASAAAAGVVAPASGMLEEAPKSQSGRRQRNAEALRQHLKELGDALGPRELDLLVAFAEFLKARRAARGFAHHHEHMLQEREAAVQSQRGSRLAEVQAPASSSQLDKGTSS